MLTMGSSILAFITLAGAALGAMVPGGPNVMLRQSMVHPGLLHTEDDFTRVRSFVDAGSEPWSTGWGKLTARADSSWEPNAQSIVCRGDSEECTQNYQTLYRDAHAAYTNTIYWKVTGETANADAAVRILDAWSGTLTEIKGSADRWLAAGIYGYQLANVGELLRDYEGWSEFDAFVDMLVGIFYPMNHDFLVEHNGAVIDNYWANVSLACHFYLCSANENT